MRVFETLRDDVAEEPVPRPDWARMGQQLQWEARHVAEGIRDQQRAPWAMGLALAAVVLLGFGIHGRVASDPPSVGNASAPVARAEAPRADSTAEVTLAAGDVTVDGETAVQPGARVPRGGTVATGARSEAHLRFAAGTGVVVHEASEITLTDLSLGRVRIALGAGTVASEVATLRAGDRYEVVAGPYRMAVRGTRFSVSREGDGVAVVVDEGVVEVFRGAFLEARVSAPSRWQSGFEVTGPEAVTRPAAVSAEAGSWPTLQVSVGTTERRVRIGDQFYEVSGELALRVPTGPIRISHYGPSGTPVTSIVQVGPAGAVAEGAPLTGDAPRVAQGYLAPALIAPPVRAGMRRLQGCHEQEARRGDAPSGVFALRVTIGLMGDVQRAQLIQRAGNAPSALFRRCVVDEAKRWDFPPPTGGTVTFEQPLRFTTRMN